MAGIPGIIYPPTLDFEFLVQRPQQLLKALSRMGVTIYFLNCPALNQAPRQAIERYNEHFYIFNHSRPSYPSHIKPVVYYSNPAQVDSLGKYNHSLLVFDSLDEAADEFASWKPYYHRAVTSADLVLTASKQLYLKARDINQHTLLLPNGCDYEYFEQARQEVFSAPPYDFPDLRKQAVIGYIGAIASWCDLELLKQLAEVYADCSLVIIGPLLNVRNAPQLPNMHWLGYKPYEQLVDYARYFDVGIIPFKMSEMTKAVNPIKMWEYMAMGIPVVSTALPEALALQEVVYYSVTPNEFISNVGRALRNESWQRCKQRMDLARDNSWTARAEQMKLAIEERLRVRGICLNTPLPIPITAANYLHQSSYNSHERVRFPLNSKFRLFKGRLNNKQVGYSAPGKLSLPSEKNMDPLEYPTPKQITVRAAAGNVEILSRQQTVYL